jgi:hypothetical protein
MFPGEAMSKQTSADNPNAKRRQLRIFWILGSFAILITILTVAAPWIADHSGLRNTAINSFGWISALCISAILLALLIVAAPWIVAHSRLRDSAINSILASPSMRASSDSASFGWFFPLSVHGFRVNSANNHIDLRAKDITAERSLLQLCSSLPDLGTIKVEKPHVRLEVPLDVQVQGLNDRRVPTFTAIVKDAALAVRLHQQEEPVIDVDDISTTFRVEKAAEGSVLTLDPVVLFNKRKLSPKLANKLLHLFDPTMSNNPQISGAVSLYIDKLRIPIGISRDREVKSMELEGRLALHEVSTEVSNPIQQALVQLVADMNGKKPSEVARLVHDAEICFHVRDGRLYHEGLRIGFPDIDPELQLTSRGSVGLDKTLDLFVELPRLDKALRQQKGPAKCHITGTIDNPKIAIEDASLVLRQYDRNEPIIAADGINLNMQIEHTASGAVLAIEPVEVFKKKQLSLGVAAGLVKFLAPDVHSDREVTGEISLSFHSLRIPLGLAREQEFKQLEAEGRLTLHQVASEVKSPLWQGLIRILAVINGEPPSNVIRLVEESEIHFQMRDGRVHHDGQRIGFPEIDPDLVISSSGSIGIDETLDLYLEMPRLLKHKRDQGPLRCHVTGTIHEPKITLQDPPLVVRWGMAGSIMKVCAWGIRTILPAGSLRREALWTSMSYSISFCQFLQSSLTRKISKPRRRLVPTCLRAIGGSLWRTGH